VKPMYEFNSQLATLEEPQNAIRIEVALPLAAQVRDIRRALSLDT